MTTVSIGLAPRRLLAQSLGSVLVLLAGPVGAYSTKTVVSDGCHEDMTQRALADARAELGPVDVVPDDRNERALIDDLPFDMQEDLRDLGAATLVLSNHNVDFRGNEPGDLDRLAPLHGAPDRQREHCLREPEDDGVEGSHAALTACRDFIREKVSAALDGVGPGGLVDPSARKELRVALDIRGSVEASLPTFHVEMGQALHAIQDGFSHSYRTDDQLEVVSVLNYVDMVEGSIDEADGPEHRSALDECHGLDELRTQRLEVATRASEEFLIAALDPELSRNQRLAETDRLLDKYLTHTEGCNADNDWCDAPEAKYREPTAGCQFAGPHAEATWPVFGLALLGLVSVGRRRALRRGPRSHLALSALLAASAVSRPTLAQTDTEANSAEPDPATSPVTSEVVAREDARIEREPGTAWGGALNVSASVQNPAFAIGFGVRYRLSEHWIVGADGEYNPWYAEQTGEFRRGVASAYATGILRFPMRFERTNLRSTLELGASRMLFDLYGVPKGTTGPFIGLNLLGIDYELGDQIYLVVNPAHIALPIPQTTGAPFSYVQYRFTLGFQFGA